MQDDLQQYPDTNGEYTENYVDLPPELLDEYRRTMMGES